MYALTYISVQTYQLITVALFVLLFAVVVALATKAGNVELVSSTAGYAAVLVVFIGQNLSNGDS